MISLERQDVQPRRLWTEQQRVELAETVFAQAVRERLFPEITNPLEVATFIARGIDLIQHFEQVALPHPQVYPDTDIIYIDSGPGPYSYDSSLLQPGKTDLDDKNYHKWSWSRKMDRARTRAAYVIAGMVTAERTGKSAASLKEADFQTHGPSLMYTSTDWQNPAIRFAAERLRERTVRYGDNDDEIRQLFAIPESKIIMYDTYINKQGETKKIIHTGDQIQGLQFPKSADGTDPRRIVMVSHPAHLLRILCLLQENKDRIPAGSTLQLFPLPTPVDGVTEYAQAELLGTIRAIYSFGEASATPYSRYEI